MEDSNLPGAYPPVLEILFQKNEWLQFSLSFWTPFCKRKTYFNCQLIWTSFTRQKLYIELQNWSDQKYTLTYSINCSLKNIGSGISFPRILLSSRFPILTSKTSSFECSWKISNETLISGNSFVGTLPWHGTEMFQKHSVLSRYGFG